MKVQEICDKLESWAPLSYQESYDNSGLITGNPSQIITGILVSLDCIESVVDEAIKKKCNMIVSHHPILFKGIKSITGKNYVERTLLKAIKHDIALYAIHTNLDNIYHGVCHIMSERIGLINSRILFPKKSQLKKLVTYSPKENIQALRSHLFDAGAGSIGEYSECSFSTRGIGTFRGSNDSNPVIGKPNVFEEIREERIELIFPAHLERKIIYVLKKHHPYKEVAYQVIGIENENQHIGSGRIGELKESIKALEFMKILKKTFKLDCIRHSKLLNKEIKTVALCGGAGSFLLGYAKEYGADVFISSDFKYHEFFDSDNSIIVADIGHYETEQYTIDLIGEFLRKNFTKFAIHLSKINTNPINYM